MRNVNKVDVHLLPYVMSVGNILHSQFSEYYTFIFVILNRQLDVFILNAT